METPPLIYIRSSFVHIDIHGPSHSKWGSLQNASCNKPFVDVKTDDIALDAKYRDSDGQLMQLINGQNGPIFFEDTNYRLRVKSVIPGLIPTIVHRDPYLLKEVDCYSDDSMCAGPFNFRRQVGRSTLEFRVGHRSLQLTLEVFPAKLDYNNDYRQLVEEVASASRGLALEYLRATYQFGRSQETEKTSTLEWLILLRNQIDSLERAVVYINEHPHRTLSRDTKVIQIEKVRKVDSLARRAIILGKGRGQYVHLPQIGRVKSQIPILDSRETVNTLENRWIKLNLRLILERLAVTHLALAAEIAKQPRIGRPLSQRILQEEREVSRFINTLKRLLSLSVFNEVSSFPPQGFSSLTLLGSTGYSEAYQAITVLRLGLNISGGKIETSFVDVHDLYETWCFIKLIHQIANITSGSANFNDLIQVSESGLRVQLQKGTKSSISYKREKANQTIVVSYNLDFAGLTGNQRPDIILRFKNSGWPDFVVVFDAKYRLDASGEYKKRFGVAGPPQDTLNTLHRYRDAIIIESADRGMIRPVVKGVALYPLNLEHSKDFNSSKLYSALESVGIGALPYLPSNTEIVEKWLKYLFSLSPEELAEPGPPFGGLDEKHKRQT